MSIFDAVSENDFFKEMFESVSPSLATESEMPFLELLPNEYREEVSKILARNPKNVSILQQCKHGEIDYWEALALMRRPECQGCQHYSRGWCLLAQPGSQHNIEFLAGCPKSA